MKTFLTFFILVLMTGIFSVALFNGRELLRGRQVEIELQKKTIIELKRQLDVCRALVDQCD